MYAHISIQKSSFVATGALEAWEDPLDFFCTRCTCENPLFTAREEPLWRSKWPLGPARVLLERSEGLFWFCFGATRAL